MKIAFIGAGYVGLTSAVLFASLGHEIISVDLEEQKIADLQKGLMPIYEPELDSYLDQALKNGKIIFTTDFSKIIDCKAIFVATGTPVSSNGSADLTSVYDAIEKIIEYNSNALIIIKSTVPPLSSISIYNYFLEKRKISLNLASNPEFLREGKAVNDFLYPDRIVVGLQKSQDKIIFEEIYKLIINNERSKTKCVFTDTTTAELIKYAANSFLATKLTFINEIADLSEKLGTDIETVTYAMGLDKRIGADFLKVGPGFGGSCFPKDISALLFLAEQFKSPLNIALAASNSNKNRAYNIVLRIVSLFGGKIENKKIAILGLTFKAQTDDIRSSPALQIAKILHEKGALLTAYDPKILKKSQISEKYLNCFNSPYEALKESDLMIIATEWEEFKALDFEAIKKIMKQNIIFDLRNILNFKMLEDIGYKIINIGRKNV